MFLSARGNLLVCKISSLSSIRNTIFKKICHIFDKYVIAIFSLKFVYIFSPIVTEIFRFGSKLSQKYALRYSALSDIGGGGRLLHVFAHIIT